MNTVNRKNIKNIYFSSFWFSMRDSTIASFLTVYLLRLNANNFIISLNEMIIGVVTVLAIIFNISRVDNSKRSFIKYIFVDRLGFLVFAVTLFFTQNPLLIIILFGLYSIIAVGANVLTPNMLKEAVPKKIWGKVFSKNKIVLITSGLITSAIAGFFLDELKEIFPYNFIFLFLAAGIFYNISLLYLRKIEVEVFPVKQTKSRKILLKQIDSKLISILMVYAPIYLITPLWSIYHVKILNFSNYQIGMLTAASFFGGFVSLTLWGYILDRFDNSRLFILSSILMASIPFIYIIHSSFYYLLSIQFVIGIISNGFEVITQNNLMSNSKEAKYDYAYISNYQIYNGMNRIVFPTLGVLLYSSIGIGSTFLLIGFIRIVISFIANILIKKGRFETDLEVD